MAAANRDERLQLMLTAQELRAVDDFRYRFRLPSRAAAVRELMLRGLAAPETGSVIDGSHSKDFGVIASKHSADRFEDIE